MSDDTTEHGDAPEGAGKPSLEQLAARREAAKLRAKRLVVRFFGVFSAIMVAFYLVWVTPLVKDDLFPHYLNANAEASAALLRLFGADVRTDGQIIRSSVFTMEVARGCDGLQPIMLFLAAMIALPSSRKAKVQGGLAGTAILLALNLLRIVSLYFIGVHYPDFFHMMHVDVWQTIFIFIALFLWALWALWALRIPEKGSDGPPPAR